MTINEIKTRLDQLASAWEDFKQINDQKLKEISQTKTADPLYQEQLNRLNDHIDQCQNRISHLESSHNRPNYSNNVEVSDIEESDIQYKKAFTDYLRKGNDNNLMQLENKALSTITDSDGGYLVSPQMSNNIIQTLQETSPMRKLCSVVTISSDSLEILADTDEAEAGWAAETAPRNDTKTPTINKKTIPLYELYAQPKATQKLIDDTAIDIEMWLSNKVAAIFAKKENQAFINGIGGDKPRGILTYAPGTGWDAVGQVRTNVQGKISSDSIIHLYHSLKETYIVNASFLMNRATIRNLRMIKDHNQNYLWSPSMHLTQPDTLLGLPVYSSSDMPTPEKNKLAIALADFKAAYQIVERDGTSIMRDPFTDKPFVKFYTTKRIGGDITNFEAIKLLKITE